MTTQRREIWVCIVLSIITCGFYSLYWHYKIMDDLYTLDNQPSKAAMDILLSIVTCRIYYIYLMYKIGEMEDNIRQKSSLMPKNRGILYLIFSILWLDTVNYAIMQSALNDELGSLGNNIRMQ